jgi:negative regulator of sigma E activity
MSFTKAELYSAWMFGEMADNELWYELVRDADIIEGL